MFTQVQNKILILNKIYESVVFISVLLNDWFSLHHEEKLKMKMEKNESHSDFKVDIATYYQHELPNFSGKPDWN